ncbi:MAG: hypothetical protein R2776_06150 [Flavobacteriaceae bacterium]
MKINPYKSLLLILLFVFACSSDDNKNNSQSKSDVLISGSPWTFEFYELISIPGYIGEIDSKLKTQIESEVNSNNVNTKYIFDSNGTGKLIIPSQEDRNFDWELINENQLRIIFNQGITVVFDEFEINSNRFSVEIENLHEYGGNEPLIIFGRYYYN